MEKQRAKTSKINLLLLGKSHKVELDRIVIHRLIKKQGFQNTVYLPNSVENYCFHLNHTAPALCNFATATIFLKFDFILFGLSDIFF
jgi:hypothetical protein